MRRERVILTCRVPKNVKRTCQCVISSMGSLSSSVHALCVSVVISCLCTEQGICLSQQYDKILRECFKM